MRYLKLYEKFLDEVELDEVELDEEDKELSDMTIDDFLNDDDSYIDSNGIINIKNWTTY